MCIRDRSTGELTSAMGKRDQPEYRLQELVFQARDVFSNLSKASALLETYFKQNGPVPRLRRESKKRKKAPTTTSSENNATEIVKQIHLENPDFTPQQCVAVANVLVCLHRSTHEFVVGEEGQRV
eukprot:TRINITY_DN12408_c0_g1_i3.p2 TRINITY_DN12408_c0_g1~~TRINITY_DN12408_c0_g1_i3.p2  ORF type:complete len:125 (-),score=21.66 TRINITY_DN12408_c0_g1_i3:450-824(-)